jgi:Cys-rich protein (TIGR01571 family)
MAHVKSDKDNKCICLACLATFIPFVFCGWNLYSRMQLRDKYGIEGSTVKDCLTVFCCACCAVEQHARQIGCQGCGKPQSQDMGLDKKDDTAQHAAQDA